MNDHMKNFTVWLSARSDQMCIPVVFFGYSYGGLLAYEVAASPQFLTLKNQSEQGLVHNYNEAKLTRHIIDIGGLPSGIDPAFLKAALPAVRTDYTAFETYTCDCMTPEQVNSTLHVFYCQEDQYTPSAESVQGWMEVTSGSCNLVMVEQGSHFVFMESNKIQMIVDALLL